MVPPNRSILDCLHDPKLTCGFHCWYYWNKNKSPALRRAQADAAAAPALHSRVLEWQSAHAARSSVSSQDSSAQLAEDGRGDAGSSKRQRLPESDVEKPRKRAACGGDDGSRLPGAGVEREPARYMMYGRFVRKAKNGEVAAAGKAAERATREIESGTVESRAVVSAAPREGVLGLTPTHEDEDAAMVDTQHAAPPDLASLPTAETSQEISQCDDDREPILTSADFSTTITTTSDISAQTSQSQSQQPSTTLSCIERKRLLLSTRPTKLLRALQAWITDTFELLDPFRDDEACWMHPLPQSPHRLKSGALRPRGALEKRFFWSDERGAHGVTLNFGVAVKIVGRGLSREQRDGWLTRGWHLSHLCGNWTCLNPKHATVEPGKVNIGRNACFGHRSGCAHEPPCMKERKVALGVDGKVVKVGEECVVGGVEEDGYQTWDFGSDGEERGDEEGVEEEILFDEYDVGRRCRRNRSSPGLSPCSRKVGGMGVVQAVEQAMQRSIEEEGKGDEIGELEEDEGEEDVEMSQGQAHRVDSFPEGFSFGVSGIETKQDECLPASTTAEEESQQQNSTLASISGDGEIQSRENNSCLPDSPEMVEVRTQELGSSALDAPSLDAPSADSKILSQQDDNFLPDTSSATEETQYINSAPLGGSSAGHECQTQQGEHHSPSALTEETQNINSAPLDGSSAGHECQTQQGEHHLPGASDVVEGETPQLDSSLPETLSGYRGIEPPHGNDCVPGASEKQVTTVATDSPLLAVSSTQDELQTQEDVGSLPDASEEQATAVATDSPLLVVSSTQDVLHTQEGVGSLPDTSETPVEADAAESSVLADPEADEETPTQPSENCPFEAARSGGQEAPQDSNSSTATATTEIVTPAEPTQEELQSSDSLGTNGTNGEQQSLAAEPFIQHEEVMSSIETPDPDEVFSQAHTASSASEEDEEDGWSL